jgi:hypothetical protein
MSSASFGTVNATGLNVTGILQASEIRTTRPVQVSNLTSTGLTTLSNLTVSGTATLSNLNVSMMSLASLYYIVQQTKLADLMKMFDEFEAVVQQTNEAYITYAAYKCENATYPLTKDATSAYTIEFISALAKQYTPDQPKPLYTYGRLTRDQCIDLEVDFYNRITEAQTVWENLEGVSAYEKSVAERMFLYMKSWLEFSFYSVRETRGTTNYIKGKADFGPFGTYICNMLNIPYQAVYGLLATSITIGMQLMINLINLADREGLALVEDLKVLFTHMTDMIKYQVDDYIYGLDLGYKMDINDLAGAGAYGGAVYSGNLNYARPISLRTNTNLSINYKMNLFTTLPSTFNEIFDNIRTQITRVVNALSPKILNSGSLFDSPATYSFNTSSNTYSNIFAGGKLYPMDLYPNGTPLSTRIKSTQIARELAGFDQLDSNALAFIQAYRTRVIDSIKSEAGSVLRFMKASSLEAPSSLPEYQSNVIHWLPTAVGNGANQSDLNDYYKYSKLNMATLKYKVIGTNSSNNIVLDSKHLFDVTDTTIYGVPGLSVFGIAKGEFTTGAPAFTNAQDGLLAYPVGDFTSVGGANTSDTKITTWSRASNTFTLADATLFTPGTVVIIRNYCPGSAQNQAGFVCPEADLFPGSSALVSETTILDNTRYGMDFTKYRVVSRSGNDIQVCLDSSSSNTLTRPSFEPTSNIVTPYGNVTWGTYGQYYIRPYSAPILLSNGTGNVLVTNVFTSSASLTDCFLDLAPGATTVVSSWLTMNMTRNVRKHQYGKFYVDTDANSLRSVPTLGYSFDATKSGQGAEFRTKTETGWTHSWSTSVGYGYAASPNGCLFGSYAMDENINGHNVPYALQIARGYNQLDSAVHHSAYYEHFSEWNQKLVRWRAFEMWDPIYAISEINVASNVITYNPGVLDGFKRRATDVRFDVGDPVRICFFDQITSSNAQSNVEGLGLRYVPGTPTSDYYFVKTIGSNTITLSETQGGAEVDLIGGSISNAYVVNARYDLVAGQYPYTWGGHHLIYDAIISGLPYLSNLQNYQSYINTTSTTVLWNWARHNTLLQTYGYGGHFSEYYANNELCPLWGQLHPGGAITYTMDDLEENLDGRLKEFTQALNKYNTYDWNLIQIALNEYKATLEAQL